MIGDEVMGGMILQLLFFNDDALHNIFHQSQTTVCVSADSHRRIFFNPVGQFGSLMNASHEEYKSRRNILIHPKFQSNVDYWRKLPSISNRTPKQM